jgi:hypothetical protein
MPGKPVLSTTNDCSTQPTTMRAGLGDAGRHIRTTQSVFAFALGLVLFHLGFGFLLEHV